MTTSDDLFVLIKSLSKNEKIYFKKFAQLHVLGQENVYLRLFDAVDEQEQYDERKLLKGFSEGKSPSQFSVLKNYLYNLVLKALRSYHAEDGLRAEIRVQLQNIRILFEKGLHEQCHKLFRRTLKLAEAHELLRELSEVLTWEQQLLLFGKSYDERTLIAVNKNLDKRILIYKRLENLLQYDKLEYNMAAWMRAGAISKASALLKHALLKNEKQALSVTALLKFQHIHATYCYHAGKKNDCAKYIQRELKLFESHPELLQQRVQDYILLTNNLLLIWMEEGELKNFDIRLKTFREEMRAVEMNSRLLSQALAHNYILEMQRYYISKQLLKFKQADVQLQQLLKQHKAALTQADRFAYLDLSSRMYLSVRQSTAAFDFNVQLLNEPEVTDKFQQYSDARLLNLVLHFEMKNFDTLPYLIQSFERQVMKKSLPKPLYSTVLHFLKRFPSAVDRKKKQELIRGLQNALCNTENDLLYFDYRCWSERFNSLI